MDEDLWDAYDRMGLAFLEHAADSAYNAHYDRPAVLAALGPVTGLRVLDARPRGSTRASARISFWRWHLAD